MSLTIRRPPPSAEGCLEESRMSRFKGGTLIDEAIRDLEAHLRQMCDPERYRPKQCPRCGGCVLHVHSYPERHPHGESGWPAVIPIIQYICAFKKCRATWRILPSFLARHLWRAWKTVERVIKPDDTPTARAPPIADRTQRRWKARAHSAALSVILLFSSTGSAVLEAMASRLGLDASRIELVDEYTEHAGISPGARCEAIAAVIHRLERGIRLM